MLSVGKQIHKLMCRREKVIRNRVSLYDRWKGGRLAPEDLVFRGEGVNTET